MEINDCCCCFARGTNKLRIVNLVVTKDKRTAERQGGEGIISDAWREFYSRKPFHRKITETDKQKFLDGY